MKTIMFEMRLMLRARLSCAALAVLFLLSVLAVWSGMRGADAQRASLARVAAAHQHDFDATMARYRDGGDAGYAAYYGFHLTRDAPPPLAFLAWGQRDLAPAALRVRMLGLHSQLYESENINPELALPGRYDFAFVLIYLAPLFIIVLMHDWVTAERERGRLRLLASLPLAPGQPWAGRALLRYAMVLVPLLLPALGGLLLAGGGLSQALVLALAVCLYTAFWSALAALVGMRARSSAASAAVLLGMFVCLTLLAPALANAAIARLVPVGKGMELAMAQRQEVHQGWDQPKEATFAKFFRSHPEWRDTPPVTGRFHWKWYYAMHQAGDEAVEPLARAYRQSLLERDAWTGRAGWLLPAAAAQVALHRLADTDLRAQLAYLDSIAEFHRGLRHFFYPYLFNERLFGAKDVAKLPAYRQRAPAGGMDGQALLGLALAVACVSAAAWRSARRLAHAS